MNCPDHMEGYTLQSIPMQVTKITRYITIRLKRICGGVRFTANNFAAPDIEQYNVIDYGRKWSVRDVNKIMVI